MTFTVVWSPEAASELLEICKDPANVASVISDMRRLDRQLPGGADSLGESRVGDTRVAFEGVLGITFDVLIP